MSIGQEDFINRRYSNRESKCRFWGMNSYCERYGSKGQNGCGLILIQDTGISLQLCGLQIRYAILVDLVPELIPSRNGKYQCSQT